MRSSPLRVWPTHVPGRMGIGLDPVLSAREARDPSRIRLQPMTLAGTDKSVARQTGDHAE